MSPSTGDEPAAAVAAALAPYGWRYLTDRMLARRVVGAVDRHTVVRFLTGVPGAHVGAIPPVDPADAGDERIDAVMSTLHGRPWREWALGRLCADLTASLETWQADRTSLESDLRRLLGGQ